MEIAVLPCKPSHRAFSHFFRLLKLCLFSNTGFDNRACHRKQIIIITTERSTDNTKERHWRVNTVQGHHVITVYRPVSAQLPPLQSSLIDTPSRAEAGTLTAWLTSSHLTTDPFQSYCLFSLKFQSVMSHYWQVGISKTDSSAFNNLIWNLQSWERCSGFDWDDWCVESWHRDLIDTAAAESPLEFVPQ